MEWGIRGFSSCSVTACSASAQAVGEGFDLIRAGRADAVVCGGSEAAITRVGDRRVRGDEGAVHSQRRSLGGVTPFRRRAGRLRHGRGGCRPSCWRIGSPPCAGAPLCSPSWPVTAPPPTPTTSRSPTRRATGRSGPCALACEDAGVEPGAIGYVNAHGTSTLPNDRVETLALKRLFGENVPPVSSTKSMTGHTLGAAGALEAVVCIQALNHHILPPTINQDHPDPALRPRLRPEPGSGGRRSTWP